MSKRRLEWHKQIHHGFVSYPIYEVEGECEAFGPSVPVCLDYSIASRVSILVHPFFDLNYQHRDCDKSYETSGERRQLEISVHNRCLDFTGYFSSAAELKEHQSKTKLIFGEERTPKELARLEKFIRHKEKEVVSAESASSEILKEGEVGDITEDKVAETQQDTGETAKDNNPRCITCDKTFRSTHGFDQHQRDKHNIVKPTNNAKKEEKTPKNKENAQASEQTLPVSCIGQGLGCKEKFWRASVMMRHIEEGLCDRRISYYQITRIFQYKLDKKGRQLWDHEWSSYRCPDCKGRKFKFDSLADMIEHAERGK